MTARALLRTGEYHVVGAVRDLVKMETVAEMEEFDMSSFTAMECDLCSFASVKKFCNELNAFRMEVCTIIRQIQRSLTRTHISV